MDTQITVDALTPFGVSIRTQTYTLVDGVKYAVGLPSRTAYANTAAGRMQIESDLPQPFVSAVLTVWGPEPLAEEPLAE